MNSNCSIPVNSKKKKTNFDVPLSSASSFGGLVPVKNGLFGEDHIQLINKLKRNTDNNSLTRQFFTLGLLEYVCNILNPKDHISANNKFKGIYSLAFLSK